MAPARRSVPTVPDAAEDAARVMAFVNTRTKRGTAAEEEGLPSFQAFAEWARGASIISAAATDRLVADARRRPAEAARALAHACELRETLHAAFAAVEHGRPPAPPVLAALGGHLATAFQSARLVARDDRLEWAPGPATSLEAIGHELARAASRLVTSSAMARVRACAAEDCRWWFVDDTKNRSRRWCEMKTCGNREKLRRYRAKGGS